MNAPFASLTWCGALLIGLAAMAKESPWLYQFTAGETNGYAVQISVQSESGTEVTTGTVFVATEEVSSNFARVSCRMELRQEVRRQPMWGPGGGFGMTSYGWMGNNVYPNGCEIDLDLQGRELRDTGDRVLPAPLGKLVQSIFEPLPGKREDRETMAEVAIMDAPLWLGPAENFQNSRMNGMPAYYPGNGARNAPGLLYVTRKSVVKFGKSGAEADNLAHWHKQCAFESRLSPGGTPEFAATTESDFSFDPGAGVLMRADTEGDVVSQTDTTSRKAKVSFHMRRLTLAEVASALVPVAPPPPRLLTGADLDKLLQDLQSPELERRREAVRQLNGAKVANPPAGMVEAVAAMALDSDMSAQMGAASFLTEYGTTNQSPVLIKMLRTSNWGARQDAVKALERLKDITAIQPLVDAMASNPNMNQDLNSGLIHFGPAAEPAVLTLLSERNTDTRRQACAILQEIETTNSLPKLQDMAGDPDQSLTQAASDAIRAIRLRQ
jgi:hypothetical protein